MCISIQSITGMVVINLHVRGKDIVIVGNGCAGAECIKALRESGYNEKIHLFTDGRWPVSNPMLTTYYVAGKIGFDRLFPYGASQDILPEVWGGCVS